MIFVFSTIMNVKNNIFNLNIVIDIYLYLK